MVEDRGIGGGLLFRHSMNPGGGTIIQGVGGFFWRELIMCVDNNVHYHDIFSYAAYNL